MSHVKLVSKIQSTLETLDLMNEVDLREVVEIEQLSNLSQWGYEAYRAELLRPEAIMFVARKHGAVVLKGERLHGFIAARLLGDELHINNIAVRTTSRRKGIGSALLSAALDEARRGNAQLAFLEVRASNGAAVELYSQHGFHIAGRRASYYRTPPEDALVMAASLCGFDNRF